MHRITTGSRAFLLAAAAAGIAATTAAPAQATPATAANAAAGFLAGQLQGSPTPNHFVSSYEFGGTVYSYDDIGLTLDGIFALTATSAFTSGPNYTSQANAALAYVKANANTYVGAGTTNSSTCAVTGGDLNAGALAKFAIAVAATGGNPGSSASTGGRNLFLDLRCRETAAGRFSNTASPDYSNTFTQSLAILLFKQYGASYTNPNGSTITTAVNYLKAQQCTNAGFVGAFRSDLGLAPGACTAATVDVDSTAVAADALYAAGETTAGNNALTWIRSAGLPTGLSPVRWQSTACTGTAADSVNSTGLAITANSSRPAGPLFPQSGPQNWLEAQQNATTKALPGCASPYPAVATSNDVRATTQGILGLLGIGFPI